MNNQIDLSIPVLTEIIPPDADYFSEGANDEGYFPALEQESNQEPHDNNISAEEWQQLEQTLRENVLRQVLSRIDFVLEHRVRDSLADVLQTAVESLAVEIRSGLHNTLEEVITRAVSKEISRAKSTK